MDSYQAIYDATRSRIGNFDGSQLASEISSKFDFSHHAEMIKENISFAAIQHTRPCVMFRPKISIDGNQWCALYGDDLQNGVAGFGGSVDKAMDDFDKNWSSDLEAVEEK